MTHEQPHSIEAVARRSAEICRPGEPVGDRIAYLTQRIKGARVLDVGVVEHDARAAYSAGWLHRHISAAASYCLGIDILAQDIEFLQKDGFNVRCHNLIQSPIRDDFDYVILGELLEHVGDAESMLRNASASLHDQGRIFLTTPNPWYINYIRMAVKSGWALDNTDHVSWFDPATLHALGQRCDLQLVAFSGLSGMHIHSRTGRMAKVFLDILSRFGIGPLLSCKSILYEFQKISGEK